MLPTRRIARDAFRFLGLEFIRMDFGGQSQYREEYLKNPTKYIDGTDLIFYVIDVQDFNRYVETIDYLDQILLYLKEEQEYPPIAALGFCLSQMEFTTPVKSSDNWKRRNRSGMAI